MQDTKYEHIPVLLKETVEFLKPKSGGTYFDATLGFGGYSEEILKASGPDGIVVAVDVDDFAIARARERLNSFGKRFVPVMANFADIEKVAGSLNLKFDGVVADLGVSSYQLDEPTRGFSFQKDGPLDMRMGVGAKATAAEVVNGYSQKKLEEIFENYGEEKFARRIAAKIIEKRGSKRIETTSQLEEICFVSYPSSLRKGRTHPATRVFQAIRIEVNSELASLEKFLVALPKVMKKGGIAVVVSYHSLEDRLVKNSFRELKSSGTGMAVIKKPLVATEEEMSVNPRSRSGKLRVAQFG